jgi:hypothetical protein
VHVTEAACEALSKLLGRAGPERCLRLSTIQGNYRFIVDEPIEQDILYRHEERVVLAVSDTVSHDLWAKTIDCAGEGAERKLIFRKARAGEPLDTIRDDTEVVPAEWRATQHERLLAEIAEIEQQKSNLRSASKTLAREKLHTLEQEKQEKWDAIRALWAGDGGWHKLNGGGAEAAATASQARALAD